MMLLPLMLAGCGDTMSNAEIKTALDESAASARVEALTTEVVEISTDFTIGEALEDAADELRAWYASQVPCSTVTRDGATVTVDFGPLEAPDAEGACTYDGHTYAGVLRLTVTRDDADDVEVLHAWEGLSNGDVTVDGSATVTWAGGDGGAVSRHVLHEVTWTDVATGVTEQASGDRTQRLVDPAQGIAAGVQIDGERDWSGQGGDWHLQIEGVQVRGQDPVPQAGAYALTSPTGKDASLSFERIDPVTIQVTLTSGWRTRVIQVASSGE